ncbi:MAG TPA: hypothetical protein VIM73_23155 [Polyangiaceae bacterium]
MSTVHLVGGEKGGVGKSVVARLLAQLFIDRNLPFAALDADTSHGALARCYGEFTRPVDLERLESADQILDRALGADRRVVVDLPAQSQRALQRWMEATGVLSYAREMDVGIVLWHVTDGGFDSVSQLERTLEALGDAVRYVLVKNEGRSKDFAQLETSRAYALLQRAGGRVVTLPALDPAVMYKIDHFGSSLWAAVNTTEGDRALGPLERRRAKLWLERAHAALDEAGDWPKASSAATPSTMGTDLRSFGDATGAS